MKITQRKVENQKYGKEKTEYGRKGEIPDCPFLRHLEYHACSIVQAASLLKLLEIYISIVYILPHQ